ncbi:hypothetical protein THAOC_34814, partial [Thalassiosira oceanica]
MASSNDHAEKVRIGESPDEVVRDQLVEEPVAQGFGDGQLGRAPRLRRQGEVAVDVVDPERARRARSVPRHASHGPVAQLGEVGGDGAVPARGAPQQDVRRHDLGPAVLQRVEAREGHAHANADDRGGERRQEVEADGRPGDAPGLAELEHVHDGRRDRHEDEGQDHAPQTPEEEVADELDPYQDGVLRGRVRGVPHREADAAPDPDRGGQEDDRDLVPPHRVAEPRAASLVVGVGVAHYVLRVGLRAAVLAVGLVDVEGAQQTHRGERLLRPDPLLHVVSFPRLEEGKKKVESRHQESNAAPSSYKAWQQCKTTHAIQDFTIRHTVLEGLGLAHPECMTPDPSLRRRLSRRGRAGRRATTEIAEAGCRALRACPKSIRPINERKACVVACRRPGPSHRRRRVRGTSHISCTACSHTATGPMPGSAP